MKRVNTNSETQGNYRLFGIYQVLLAVPRSTSSGSTPFGACHFHTGSGSNETYNSRIESLRSLDLEDRNYTTRQEHSNTRREASPKTLTPTTPSFCLPSSISPLPNFLKDAIVYLIKEINTPDVLYKDVVEVNNLLEGFKKPNETKDDAPPALSTQGDITPVVSRGIRYQEKYRQQDHEIRKCQTKIFNLNRIFKVESLQVGMNPF